MVEEVTLDHISASPEPLRITKPKVGVRLRGDMPEDRPAASFDHRFGSSLVFLGQPRSQTASQDDDFRQKNSMAETPGRDDKENHACNL